MGYQVRIVHKAAQDLAVVRFRAAVTDLGQQMAAALAEVAGVLARRGAPPGGPAVAYYEAVPGGFSVAAGFPVGQRVPAEGSVVPMRLPECDVATTTHLGRYEDLTHAYDALKQGVTEQGRGIDETSGMWEEYWSPPGTPPEQARTEIFWPVKRR